MGPSSPSARSPGSAACLTMATRTPSRESQTTWCAPLPQTPGRRGSGKESGSVAMNVDDIPALARQVCDEVAAVFTPATVNAAGQMCDEIMSARRIAGYGVGREGLMMRALCMRLMHLGLDAHVVGDMTTPPIATGDLLMVSAGPGAFSTVLGLMGVAREAGARTLVITAQPDGEAARRADVTIHLPAQTM